MSALEERRPILRSVLGEVTGPAAARIERALGLLLEELGMEVAFVGELEDGARVVTHTASAPGVSPVPVGMAHPVEETLCHLFMTGDAGPVMADVRAGGLADHPHTKLFDVGAYAGVPLQVDGTVVGALCCASSSPVPVIEDRVVATLRTVADYVETLLHQPSTGTADPTHGRIDDLERVAGSFAEGGSLESLSRPLLEMLQAATSLESTFLTTIDWAADEQRVLYAVNTGDLTIPEGITVEWSDTLCRRSLDEGRQLTTDVPAIWGDSEAAAALGIRTYVSVPITDKDSTVIGTLCGTSRRQMHVDPRNIATMRLFAALVGQQISAQANATTEQRRAEELESRLTEINDLALRDPLTGLRNRRGIERWLAIATAGMRPGLDQIAVAFCDLDRFKAVNDTLGHAAGDAALRSFAAALLTVGRGADLHGRLGGDEFVLAAVLPTGAAALGAWTGRVRHAARATAAWPDGTQELRASVGVASFDDTATTPEDALSAADAAMYRDKARNRAGR